jgi:hypothetical protein
LRLTTISSLIKAFAFVFAFMLAPMIYADDGFISVGPPVTGGSVSLFVRIPGIFPVGAASDTGTVLIKVDGIVAGNNAAGAAAKAAAIAAKINKVYGAPPNVATINPATPTRIDLVAPAGTPKAGEAGQARITLNGDKTGEGALLASLDLPPSTGSLIAYAGWDTGLSGIDALGGISTFTTAIGYAGFDDSVTLAFNQLPTPTLDGLTSDMYAQLLAGLPAALKPDLILDLADDQILFDFPAGQTGYFVQNLTTDTGVGLSGGLGVVVPEPGYIPSLALLGVAGYLSRRRFCSRNVGPTTHPNG